MTYQVEFPSDILEGNTGDLKIDHICKAKCCDCKSQTFGPEMIRKQLGVVNKAASVDATAVKAEEEVESKHGCT